MNRFSYKLKAREHFLLGHLLKEVKTKQNKIPVTLGRGEEGCVTFLFSLRKDFVLFCSFQLMCFLLWFCFCSNRLTASFPRSCCHLPLLLPQGLLFFFASSSFLSPVSLYLVIGPSVRGSHQSFCHPLISLCEPSAIATCSHNSRELG